jgi:hypothetical protein
MSEITDQLLYGHYTNVEGQDIDVLGDIERLYTDELDLVQRPSVFKRIGVTAAGIVAAAVYYNNRNRELAIKGIYALFAAGVGINIGIASGDSRVDSAAAAGLYYGFTKASASLNLTGEDRSMGYESLAGFAAGLAYDWYLRSQVMVKGKGKRK